MDKLLEFAALLIRLIKPKHNQWVVRALITSGLAMLSQPWWVAYVNAVFEVSMDASLGIGVGGWVVLGLGLGIHILNRREEKSQRSKEETLSREKVHDYRILRGLLESIHSPTFDHFIEYGRSSYVFGRIFHFWEGFRHLVERSDYHINDSELKSLVDELYDSWDRSLSFGEYFTETNNSSLYRFLNRAESFDHERMVKAHDDFTTAILRSDKAYRALLGFTRTNYPEIDIDETNETAWKEYTTFMAEQINDR